MPIRDKRIHFMPEKKTTTTLPTLLKKPKGVLRNLLAVDNNNPNREKGVLVDKSGAPVTSASFSPTPSNVRESIKYDGGGQSQGSQQFTQGSFQGPSSPGPQPTPNQPQSGPSGGGSVGGRGGRGSEDSGNSGRIITP